MIHLANLARVLIQLTQTPVYWLIVIAFILMQIYGSPARSVGEVNAAAG